MGNIAYSRNGSLLLALEADVVDREVEAARRAIDGCSVLPSLCETCPRLSSSLGR
jgi:hypothetical protein